MNVPIVDGKIGIEEPLSKAGDLVDLRAETDLLVAISNCPPPMGPDREGAFCRLPSADDPARAAFRP
jgi:uncharacterized protein YcgI (DUF1989 family)